MVDDNVRSHRRLDNASLAVGSTVCRIDATVRIRPRQFFRPHVANGDSRVTRTPQRGTRRSSRPFPTTQETKRASRAAADPKPFTYARSFKSGTVRSQVQQPEYSSPHSLTTLKTPAHSL